MDDRYLGSINPLGGAQQDVVEFLLRAPRMIQICLKGCYVFEKIRTTIQNITERARE